jgi:NAD(P)H-dependent flavin oxidoreductase YrpB (nitropropane dioxygenase family)
VVTKSIDGHPQRVIRTKLVESLEGSGWVMSLLRAMRHAWTFRSITGTSMFSLLKEGWAMKHNNEMTWSQVAMAANAPILTRASMVDGRYEVGILPTGQNVGVIDELPSVADLVERIVREAESALAKLGA